MKMGRLISAIIALLLVVNLSVTAFAAEWYLEDGDITVSAGDNGQTVSQGSNTDVADDAPVIKQRDSAAATCLAEQYASAPSLRGMLRSSISSSSTLSWERHGSM